MPDEDQEKKYMKNYYYKRKNLLNHLTNCVGELKKIFVLKSRFLNIIFLNS